jgi:hypothetical protein
LGSTRDDERGCFRINTGVTRGGGAVRDGLGSSMAPLMNADEGERFNTEVTEERRRKI